MNVTDVEVCVKHLVSEYMAPEVVEELARDEWFDAAGQRVTLRAFSGISGMDNVGMRTVAWCVDESEDMYLVRYNPETHMVNASYHKKATKNPHH